MPQEIFTFVYDTIIDRKLVKCVHYASIETMADPVCDVKHIQKLRNFTGLPVGEYTILKGYFSADEAMKKAAENG